MEFKHQPVLINEVLHYLAPKANENFIDCTIGGGGHAGEILKKNAPKGKILGIDLDKAAINAASENLKEFGSRVILINDNYKNLKKIVYDVAGFTKINGILLDLGLSSYELEDETRGFSFRNKSPLDMRFGSTDKTAAYILNQYKEDNLIKIFKEFGEERYARQIAGEIIEYRKLKPISTTDQLVDIIEAVYKNKPKPKIHVATKVFQALRIAVNEELINIKEILPQAVDILEGGGRIAIISFHSLEDKIIKNYFRQESKGCICPPKLPICNCGHKAKLKLLTKKVIIPQQEEIAQNPRSRSAKLRVAIKI